MTDPRFENTSASISLLNHHHLEMSAEAIDGDVVMEEPPAEEVRSRYSALSMEWGSFRSFVVTTNAAARMRFEEREGSSSPPMVSRTNVVSKDA